MSRNHPPYIALTTVAFLFSLCFCSCFVGDFLGAYFNTYYNAQKLFSEAEDDIWSSPETKTSGRNLLLTLNASSGAKQKFTSVIEKCSKLLQYHPESKLVDDALLMVGKAYFYQADYSRAERKFQELIDTYPKSGLLSQARMLMAYSYYKAGNVDTALALGTQVLDAAKEAGDDDVEAYAALLIGQIEQDRKNFTAARDMYLRAGEKAGNPDLRTSAYLTSAEIYYKSGDSLHAYDAYVRAEKEASNYIADFRSRIGQARMLAKLGRADEGMDLLQRLRRNSNFKEFWGEVDLEIGNIYRLTEAYDSAIRQYIYIDTAYARSEAAANADYQLGQIYEKYIGQLDSARAAYQRGRSASPQWQITPALLQRSDLLNRYEAARTAVRLNDSLRTALLESGDSTATFLSPAAPAGAREVAAPGNESPRPVELAPGGGRPGGRFSVPDSALRMPRTAEAETGRRPGRFGTTDTLRPGQHAGQKDSLAGTQRPALQTVTMDTVSVRLQNAMNDLATLWFTGFGNADSALYWFNRLLVLFPSSRQAPRALFTIAQIYAGLDSVANKPTMDSLYRVVVNRYPRSEFAAEARAKLGLPPMAALVDPAEAAYHRGEQLLLSGHYAEAVDTMRSLNRNFPASPFALRAEYAAGWMYEQELSRPDSAIAIYRRLAQRYPASTYAAMVRPKLEAVDQQKAAPPAPMPGVAGTGPAATGARKDSVGSTPPPPRPAGPRKRAVLEDSVDVPVHRAGQPADSVKPGAPPGRPVVPDTTQPQAQPGHTGIPDTSGVSTRGRLPDPGAPQGRPLSPDSTTPPPPSK